MADKGVNIVARRGTITIPTSDTVSAGTNTELNLNGLVRQVDFTVPNMEATNSTNLVITNEFGGTVFASGTKAESASYSVGSVFPIYGTVKVVAVAEGTQSEAKSIPFNLVVEE